MGKIECLVDFLRAWLYVADLKPTARRERIGYIAANAVEKEGLCASLSYFSRIGEGIPDATTEQIRNELHKELEMNFPEPVYPFGMLNYLQRSANATQHQCPVRKAGVLKMIQKLAGRYQRGPLGRSIPASDYPPIPKTDLFFTGTEYKPAKVLYWCWRSDYNKWGACVDFGDRLPIITNPKPE